MKVLNVPLYHNLLCQNWDYKLQQKKPLTLPHLVQFPQQGEIWMLSPYTSKQNRTETLQCKPSSFLKLSLHCRIRLAQPLRTTPIYKTSKTCTSSDRQRQLRDIVTNTRRDHIIRSNGPTAMQSKLGYLISGRVTSTANTINSNYPTNMLNILLSHVDEDNQIERFWNLESLGTTTRIPLLTKQDHSRILTNSHFPGTKRKLHSKIPLEERSPSASYEPHCLRETY